jgi:putative membrane protein
MLIRLVFASLHLLALGIGVGAIWARARALRGPLDSAGIRRVFYADALWGIAGGLWIVTGLARAFSRMEKGSAYYLHNHLFWAKMSLLVLILLLEIAPMVGLIRWRSALAKGKAVDTRRAKLFIGISHAQLLLVIVMVVIAAALTRGAGH